MPAAEKNTVSSPPRQMLMRPVALDGTGAFHEGEPTFNYEHKQSDLDEPCWSHTGWKTNQPVDASSEMPLGWLAIQSLSPGEFPPLGVPLPLSFYGAALLKKKKNITWGHCHAGNSPKSLLVRTGDLAPLSVMPLVEMIWLIENAWDNHLWDGTNILALVPSGFVYFDKTCIFCQGRLVEYMYCTSLQSRPLNK